MWLFLPFGFYSVVQKSGAIDLTVRARARADLDRLRERYMPALSATVVGGGTDYPYRAMIGRAEFVEGLGKIVRDLTYSNFKNEVARVTGPDRAHLYGEIWARLQVLEGTRLSESPPVTPVARSRESFGGVVFRADGHVLLREPVGHFDGYVWTFPKGRPSAGESPEAAALREVREETGVVARVETRLPESFKGGTGETVFFVMSLVEETGQHDAETASIRWASLPEARVLIRQSTNRIGRTRDLAVLDAAATVRNGPKP